MAGAAHRIGRLRLRLTAQDEAGYRAVARRFSDRYETQILPALQDALDAIDRPGQVIRLERLELDLGALDPAAPDFGPALRRALAAALHPGPADRSRAIPAGQTEAPAAGPAAADPGAELVAFLRSGMLPWPAPGAALDALFTAVLTLAPEALAALARRLLPGLIGASAARRFLLQLPLALQQRLAAGLAGWPVPAAPAAAPPVYLSPAMAAALEPLLTALARTGGALPQAVTFAAALAAPEAVAAAAEANRTAAIDPTSTGAIDPTSTSATDPARPGAAARARTAAPDPTLPPGPEAAPASGPAPDRPEPDPAEALPRHPVTAAGAVLLHPYLGAFFRSLGLTEAGQFRDPEARGRAVLLGQFLATGDERPAEPDCLLMKLLCGLPLTAPLPRDTRIGAAERAEAEALLTAVIGHWGRLGAATPEGLREGFLRRPGLLRLAGEGPVLTVERRTIDILLDRLPWALSRVKTPFMDRVLAVEWT
jgi:hypothetical protein